MGRDTVLREHGQRRLAGDDHQRRSGDRAPFAGLEPRRHVLADADLGGQRQMDQRDDPQTGGFALQFGGHSAEGKAVDEHRRTIGDGREHASRVVQRPGGRVWKASVELSNVNRPVAGAEARDHAPVVLVAPGPGLETPGNDEDERAVRLPHPPIL